MIWVLGYGFRINMTAKCIENIIDTSLAFYIFYPSHFSIMISYRRGLVLIFNDPFSNHLFVVV